MATVLILGAGVMAGAFTFPLAEAGNDVRLVGTPHDAGIIDSVRATGEHPALKLRLHERVRAFHHQELTSQLDDAVELIVFGVSSPGIPWAIEQMTGKLPGRRPILLLAKGMLANGGRMWTFPHLVEAALDVPCGAIAGPCIAQELALHRPTSVICTFQNMAEIAGVLRLVDVPYYHVRPSTDRVGVEVCAAMKNFYTLGITAALGVLDRLGPDQGSVATHNLTASLFTQGVLELGLVNAMMGGLPQTVTGLAGTGDLYITIQGGRNARMGRLLGRGLRPSEAREQHLPGITLEGVELTQAIGPTMREMMRKGVLDREQLPLSRAIIAAIVDDQPMIVPWSDMHRLPQIYGDVR